uniref:(northern house mosquito) hypothetical protein n=1 Tax=Culex pipiens TaxID=7175 RepID=A0A8D8ESA2_CULPI
MRSFSTVAILLACLGCQVYGDRSFWRGKKFSQDGPSRNALLREVSGDVKTLWFDQLLDHNDPTNAATWKQRYYVCWDEYKLLEAAVDLAQLKAGKFILLVWYKLTTHI